MFLILKSMLTYITQALSVFLFYFEKYAYITQTVSVFDFKKYADLHHPHVVCFFFILKSMLTYITQT